MKKNLNTTRKENFLAILNVLKSKQILTKPKIARLTGLSTVTVNNAINDLISANIVVESGIANSNGGRKAALFSFNEQQFRIVGINLYSDRIIVTLFDLGINILKSNTRNVDVNGMLIEECVNCMSRMVRELLEEMRIGENLLLGIGIAIPGTVDNNMEIVYNMPRFDKWKNIPLRNMLEKEFSARIYMENDANCGMVALKWKNIIADGKNCVYLSTNDGTGARIMMDGKIFRGNEGISGEVGHVSVDRNGPPCKCGNRGCLELYTSDSAIFKNVVDIIEEKREGLLYEMCKRDTGKIDFRMILEACKLGDEYVVEVINEAAKYMTLCIDMILKIVAPEELIIESDWLSELNNYYFSILNSTYKNSSFFRRSDVKILLNTLKDPNLLGSGTIVLDRLLTSIENNTLLEIIS